MQNSDKTYIRVSAKSSRSLELIWKLWTYPEHIVNWNHASDDWHTTTAENDLVNGGRFSYRMEAKDGSFGFDFSGKYQKIIPYQEISILLDDNREVKINFNEMEDGTEIIELFEPENQNSLELQQSGWQAIMDNFKKYADSIKELEKQKFSININAPVEKVYSMMINKESYQEWTKVFNSSSSYTGSWEKGSKILFTGCDEADNIGGMVSSIKENIPNKYISIRHLGILKGEEEIISGPEVKDWTGLLENYIFNDQGDSVLLEVELHVVPEFKEYFDVQWPLALAKLKEICEL